MGITDFIISFQGVYGLASGTFHHVLSALNLTLSNWFQAIAENTSSFVILGYPFLPIYNSGYLALEMSDCLMSSLDIY
jgi:hypothetical protein